jgi:hypothetical protein
VLAAVAGALTLLADMAPEQKDVMIAILGASAALGGLVLVFLGTIIAAYQALPSDAPKAVKGRAKGAAKPIIGAFLVSMASVALSVIWLDARGGEVLYEVSFVVFLLELAAIAGLAIAMKVQLLK